MLTLIVVLGFPLILAVGYTVLFVLSGRDPRVMAGPAGFLLFVALVTIPASVVLATHRGRVADALAWHGSTLAWVAAGSLGGLALWGVQRWVLPGQTPDASALVWVGPGGWLGFAVLMVPVTYGVLAEEIVWRAYLVPELGLPLSSAAFALHHYHFGMRHVLFSVLAGLAWGGFFLLAESLWPAVASHLVYNALAWRSMRRSSVEAARAAGAARRESAEAT